MGTRLQVNGVVSRKPLVKFTMRTFNFVSVCVRVCFSFVAQYAEFGTDIDAKASKTFICTTNVSLLEVCINLWRNSSAKNNILFKEPVSADPYQRVLPLY